MNTAPMFQQLGSDQSQSVHQHVQEPTYFSEDQMGAWLDQLRPEQWITPSTMQWHEWDALALGTEFGQTTAF